MKEKEREEERGEKEEFEDWVGRTSVDPLRVLRNKYLQPLFFLLRAEMNPKQILVLSTNGLNQNENIATYIHTHDKLQNDQGKDDNRLVEIFT